MSKLGDKNIAGEHIPVLLIETLNDLDVCKGQIVVDCTTNRAGHSIEIIRKMDGKGTLVCIDLDGEALKEAEQKIEFAQSKLSKTLKSEIIIHYVQDNFRNIKKILNNLEIKKVDRVLADLGLSSQELDVSGRGFSFLRDEPLYMTFANPITDETLTAKDIVNNWSEQVLADIMYHFADERYAYRIAKKIIERRKEKEINTTFELLSVIKSAVPIVYQNGKTHYATRTFQALRMAANSEVDSIKELINSLPEILSDEGRASIITFHSTEDRIVKQTARELKEIGLQPLHSKATIPSLVEQKDNPRSRSAQLRTYIYNKIN